jgi:hypothetical protein
VKKGKNNGKEGEGLKGYFQNDCKGNGKVIVPFHIYVG